ncbi:MAG: Hpt domain-containing protein [Saccharospirillum sp.]|nr:Hpt domain-containing protein [Saccharospirillum sp.]
MSQEYSEDVMHLDTQVLRELQQLLGDDFPDLVETFLKDSTQRIGELELTIESTVAEDVRYAAHSFKGSSLNLGAVRLSELCRQLEEMALHGRLYRSSECLEQIKVEFDLVAAELQNNLN